MGWDHLTPARRRDRVAAAVLRRVEAQRAALVTRYGAASTPAQRFVALADALRAAAAPGPHQADQVAVDRQLTELVSTLSAALDRIHENQRTAARTTLERRPRARTRDPAGRSGSAA